VGSGRSEAHSSLGGASRISGGKKGILFSRRPSPSTQAGLLLQKTPSASLEPRSRSPLSLSLSPAGGGGERRKRKGSRAEQAPSSRGDRGREPRRSRDSRGDRRSPPAAIRPRYELKISRSRFRFHPVLLAQCFNLVGCSGW
jgi:hypothetical protein